MELDNLDFTLDLDKEEEQIISPEGTFDACIERVEKKQNKKGNGTLMVVKFKLDNGFSIYEYLNVFHENNMAQALGRKTLRAILSALAYKNFNFANDYASLVDRMLKVQVIHETEQDGNKRAVIVKYFNSEATPIGVIEGF